MRLSRQHFQQTQEGELWAASATKANEQLAGIIGNQELGTEERRNRHKIDKAK